MTPSELIRHFDGFLSILAVIGISPAVWSFYKKDTLTALERRIYFITGCMSLGFTIRFFYQYFNLEFLGSLNYLVFIVLVNAVILYFETLLRRHFPLWFKLYFTFGSGIFILINLAGHLQGNVHMLWPFGIYVISCQIAVFIFCIFRKRKDYSKVENAMIGTSLFTLLVLAPLFLSDITSFQLPIPKMGPLGAIIFCYVSLFDQNLTKGRYHPLINILQSFAVAAVVTYPLTFIIQNREIWLWQRLFILLFGWHISMRIFLAIRQLDARTEVGGFLQALNSTDKTTVLQFLIGFRDFYKNVELKIFKKNDLAKYDLDQINEFLNRRDFRFLSQNTIRTLQEEPGDFSAKELELLDQVMDVLDIHDATHFIRVGENECYYILMSLPLVHYEQMVQMQASAITDIARLIEAKKYSQMKLN